MMAKADDKKGKKSKSRKEAKPPPKTREQKDAEKQALALWALLGNGGDGFGGQLRPEIRKSEREALRDAGLITFEKRKGGAFWLEVTDRGWRWAEDHLGDPLPDKNFGGAFVLRAWLTRLQAFLRARNLGLADVLGQQAQQQELPPEKPKQPEQPANTDYRALRDRVRRAYLDVTGGSFNTRALLSDIRPRLHDIDRDVLDDALKRMQREDDASLMQLDNRAEITDADRAAALHIGSEPRHILWITR
jgi:hypothetical protein